MLNLLDVEKFCRGLTPVTSTDFLTRTEQFHPEGLFSELIFGAVETNARDNNFSFIDLYCRVIHPTALKILLRLDRRISTFLTTENKFSIDKEGNLILDEENGLTGIANFFTIFPQIKFRAGSVDREKLIKFITRCYKDETLFIKKVPIIPPNMRPMFQDEDGNWTVDPLNDYYITIMRRASQIKVAGKSGELFDLLNYSVQKAVIDHDEFVRTKIEKKSGIVREQMLSKRVDFSARAVITPNPDLDAHHIGIPLMDAVMLFNPLLLHQLLYTNNIDHDELANEVKNYTGLDLSIDTINRVLKAIKNGDEIPKRLYDIIYQATELAMENRVVIAKRDPCLHAQGVRGYFPVLTKGNTIELSTLIVGGHGADFDGDQMAIYSPMTNESVEQVKERMMRVEAPEISSGINLDFSKEMGVGFYVLTKDIKSRKPEVLVTDKDLENITDLNVPVIYRRTKTTIGRALLNSCFPSDYPFVNKPVTKKIANQIISDISKRYGDEQTIISSNKMKNLAFKYATIVAPSMTLDMIELPPEIYKLKEKLSKATTEEGVDILAKMKVITIEHLKDTGLYDLVESGSTKGWDQPLQILAAKGIIADTTGKVLPPISASFADGYSSSEYFLASTGARKGLIDRVINTSSTGYMSRKLAYVLNSVEVDPYLTDCKTDKYLQVKLDKDLMKKLSGRFVLKGKEVVEFNPNDYKPGDMINLRTPIYCKSLKICHTCYGRLIERHKTPYVGILAAQTIGERGTQLIMRTFHTGGAVKLTKRDIISDIFQNERKISKPELLQYFKQDEANLISSSKMKMIIDLNDYFSDDYEIDSDENNIWMKSLISKIYVDNKIIDVILDYEVNLNSIQCVITKESIELQFEESDKILTTTLEKSDLKELVRYVERLMIGKEIFKDPDHLFVKMYRVYGPIADSDVVHFEILLSQCLRSKQNLSFPARVVEPYDPIMMNLRKVVFNSGFFQGLAFENLNGAIENMLTNEEELEPSILEKVFTGKLIVKEEE